MTVARFSAQPADTGPVPPRARARRLRRRLRRDPDAASAGHDIVDQALTALRNLDHRGAAGAEPDSGDGAGILHPGPGRVPARGRRLRRCPPPARTPSARPSCPATTSERAKARARDRGDRRRGGPRGPRLARRARSTPDLARRRPPAACMPRSRQLFVAGAGAARVRAWRSSGWPSACASAPSTRPSVYFPSLSARTLVYKGMLTTGQLEPFFPDLSDERFASALAARALAVLDQHLPVAGRWPTRSGSSPTTARSTPSRATATGCAPARRCSPRDLIPGDLDAALPDLHAGRLSDSASFDEVLELLHLGGRSLPHAVLMMIPEAWENHAEMDPARRAFYEFHSDAHGAVGRPGLRHLHRRHADRRGARPQRPAPGPLLGHRRRPRRARLRGRRARPRPRDASCARAGCSRAGCSSSTPTQRPDHRGRRDQGRARRRAPVRRVAARRPDRTSTTCPSASTSCTPTPR